MMTDQAQRCIDEAKSKLREIVQTLHECKQNGQTQAFDWHHWRYRGWRRRLSIAYMLHAGEGWSLIRQMHRVTSDDELWANKA